MLQRLRNTVARFMVGRYGNDALNRFLFVTYFVIWLISNFFRNGLWGLLFAVLLWAVLGTLLWRTLSRNIGASTAEICSYEEGDAFSDVVGPLGIPSDFTEMSAEELAGKKYVFIAGGVGTAPVYPQVKWLHERGIAVDVIIGAKTKDLVIYKEEMEAVCDNLYICTDDGSEGFKGLVTAMLEKLVNEDGKVYDQAVAIGPMIMMKFATLTCKKLNLPVIVSLNTLMVDGTGMCGACRVTVGGKVRFACVEGPEFDGYLVDFDEAMRRQRMYNTEEREASEHHTCRIGRGK